jgi:hypothetical protein
MANVLSKDKQITIIGALAEGSSMHAISRMTGVHRDTICRLGVRIGDVEVFDLADHPKASRVYAWSHGDPDNPQHITVLQIPPAVTPQRAVQVAIAGMFREQENAES